MVLFKLVRDKEVNFFEICRGRRPRRPVLHKRKKQREINSCCLFIFYTLKVYTLKAFGRWESFFKSPPQSSHRQSQHKKTAPSTKASTKCDRGFLHSPISDRGFCPFCLLFLPAFVQSYKLPIFGNYFRQSSCYFYQFLVKLRCNKKNRDETTTLKQKGDNMKNKKEKVYIIDSGNDFRFVLKETLKEMGFDRPLI